MRAAEYFHNDQGPKLHPKLLCVLLAISLRIHSLGLGEKCGINKSIIGQMQGMINFMLRISNSFIGQRNISILSRIIEPKIKNGNRFPIGLHIFPFYPILLTCAFKIKADHHLCLAKAQQSLICFGNSRKFPCLTP